MHDGTTHQELNDFAARLATLAPRTQLDRDGLMFAAGRRAGVRTLRRWLAGTSVGWMALVAALVMLPWRAEPQLADVQAPTVERPVAEARPLGEPASHAASKRKSPPDALTRFELQRRLVANADDDGVHPAAMQPTEIGAPLPSSEAGYRELLMQYLDESRRQL